MGEFKVKSFREAVKIVCTIICFNLGASLSAQGNPAWVTYFANYNTNAGDVGYSSTLDSFGNIIVVGTTFMGDEGENLLTIKFDSTGLKLWEAQFNSDGNLDDNVNDVLIDASGDIVIVGTGRYSEESADILTLKYSSSGELLWTQQYDGPASGLDIPQDVEIDSAGNVYVTGTSYTDPGGQNLILLKYDIGGELVWETEYDEPENLYGSGVSIVVGNEGAIFVASYTSWGSITTKLLKYSADGELIIARELRTTSGTISSTQISLCQDSGGSIYAVGLGSRYTVMKLNQDCDILWYRTYLPEGIIWSFVRAFTLDREENLILTGTIYNSEDTDPMTVKISSEGNVMWAEILSGNDNNEVPFDIGVDEDNNIYIGGNGVDPFLLKYNQAGQFIRRSIFQPFEDTTSEINAMVVSSRGICYVTGNADRGNDSDLYMGVIDSSFSSNEENRYAYGRMSLNELRDMAIDSEGNIIVIGVDSTREELSNLLTIKYDGDGLELWNNSFNPGSELSSEIIAAGTDGDNNIFCVGSFIDSLSSNSLILLKYSASGQNLFVTRTELPNFTGIYDVRLLVDSSGNSYIIYNGGIDQVYNVYANKYSPQGEHLWQAVLDDQNDAYLGGILLSGDERLIVAGNSTSVTGQKYIRIVQYDPSGTLQFENEISIEGYTETIVYTISSNTTGNIGVGGYVEGEDFSSLVLSLSEQLEVEWENVIDIEGAQGYMYSIVQPDEFGNIYFAGREFVNYSPRLIIGKINSSGESDWMRQDSSMLGLTRLIDLKLDTQGEPLLVGWTRFYGDEQSFCMKYTAGGAQDWVLQSTSELDNYTHEFSEISLNSEGDIYLAGNSFEIDRHLNQPPQSYISVAKYEWEYLSVESPPAAAPAGFVLLQNFPNPFNPTTTIKYGLPSVSDVSIKIFNIQGREIRSWKVNDQAAGWYQLYWHGDNQTGNQVPTGMYFARVQAGDYSEVVKMVYLR